MSSPTDEQSICFMDVEVRDLGGLPESLELLGGVIPLGRAASKSFRKPQGEKFLGHHYHLNLLCADEATLKSAQWRRGWCLDQQ